MCAKIWSVFSIFRIFLRPLLSFICSCPFLVLPIKTVFHSCHCCSFPLFLMFRTPLAPRKLCFLSRLAWQSNAARQKVPCYVPGVCHVASDKLHRLFCAVMDLAVLVLCVSPTWCSSMRVWETCGCFARSMSRTACIKKTKAITKLQQSSSPFCFFPDITLRL